MGQSSEEKDADDVKWWTEHKSEIQFAFKVLAGLGLVESMALSQYEKDMERVELEEAGGEDSDEIVTWEVTPTAHQGADGPVSQGNSYVPSRAQQTSALLLLEKVTRQDTPDVKVRGADPANYRGPSPFPVAITAMPSSSVANFVCIAGR